MAAAAGTCGGGQDSKSSEEEKKTLSHYSQQQPQKPPPPQATIVFRGMFPTLCSGSGDASSSSSSCSRSDTQGARALDDSKSPSSSSSGQAAVDALVDEGRCLLRKARKCNPTEARGRQATMDPNYPVKEEQDLLAFMKKHTVVPHAMAYIDQCLFDQINVIKEAGDSPLAHA